MSTRLAHIDIARGIGILLVVAGHNWIILGGKGELYRLVYSFHIPLFFILSGIFFNYEKPFWQTSKEKFQALLVPYLFTAILVEIMIFVADFQNNTLGQSLFWAFYGTGPHIRWVGMWFLPHLFLVSIFCWAFVNMLKLRKLRWYFQAALLIFMLIVGWLTIRSFWGMSFSWDGQSIKVNGLPFSADILLITSFYFMLGSLAQGWIKEREFQPVPFIISTIIFLILHVVTNSTTDLNLRKYDNLLAATALAITGSFIIVAASKFMARFAIAESVLGYLGRNSLIILIFHSLFQDNLFVLLSEYTKRYFYVGLATFTVAILGSIAVIEIVKRVEFLQKIYGKS